MGIKLLAKIHNGEPSLFNEVDFPGYEPYEIELTSLSDQVLTSRFVIEGDYIDGDTIAFWDEDYLIAYGECPALQNMVLKDNDRIITIETPFSISKANGFTEDDEWEYE